MLSKMEFHPNAERKLTDVLAFDIGETYTNKRAVKYPLQFEYNSNNTNRPKMERLGSWAGFTYIRGLLIHVAFDVFDETSDGFNANRQAIMDSFSPADPTVVQTIQTLGDLVLTFDGYTEDITAPCTLDGDVDVPISNPNYSEGQLTWSVPQGYFTGVTTPANIYYPK